MVMKAIKCFYCWVEEKVISTASYLCVCLCVAFVLTPKIKTMSQRKKLALVMVDLHLDLDELKQIINNKKMKKSRHKTTETFQWQLKIAFCHIAVIHFLFNRKCHIRKSSAFFGRLQSWLSRNIWMLEYLFVRLLHLNYLEMIRWVLGICLFFYARTSFIQFGLVRFSFHVRFF